MARRRYVSTEISTDPRVCALAEDYGVFAALLYTWMIPHADDAGALSDDPRKLKLLLIPGLPQTSADIAEAVGGMVAIGLIEHDDGAHQLRFPSAAFNRYQSYINKDRRESARSSADRRTSAQNTASSSLEVSSSSPVKSSSPVSDSVAVAAPDSAPSRLDNGGGTEETSQEAPQAAVPDTPWVYSVGDLSDRSREFLDAFRQAYGSKRPPKLNRTQVAQLEEAVLDLGPERLEEAASWAASQSVEYGGGGVIKAIRAARTKRKQDEDHEFSQEMNLNGRPHAPPRRAERSVASQVSDEEREYVRELAKGGCG